MLYVDSRKSFKARSEKKYLFAECKKTLGKLISLTSAEKKHSANLFFCRVLEKTHDKLIFLPSATNGHSANS